jgi:hypothetical protein
MYRPAVLSHPRKEIPLMRIVTTSALLGLFLVSNALAQTPAAPAVDPQVPAAAGPAPLPGTPLNPQSNAGLAKEAADGSTRVVPAVPCTTAARETDGTTTCVGIRGPVYRSGRPGAPSDETVGRAR